MQVKYVQNFVFSVSFCRMSLICFKYDILYPTVYIKTNTQFKIIYWYIVAVAVYTIRHIQNTNDV